MEIKVENWSNMNFEGNTVAKQNTAVQTELTQNREVILPVLSIHTGVTWILNFVLKCFEIHSKREFPK